MKKYDKEEYRVFYFEFFSVMEFLNYIKKTPINMMIWNPKQLASNTGTYEFTRTHSLEEAANLFQFGYQEKFDEIPLLIRQIDKYVHTNINLTRPYHDYVGYVPDVKAYLEGEPLNMINWKQPKKKCIHIYFNVSASAMTTESQIRHKGIIALSLTNILEKMGYQVCLNLFEMSFVKHEILYTKFVLKKENERLNMKKLYFPMCHPSFLRRLHFRLTEETVGLSNDWPIGYGTPCSEELVQKIIGASDNNIFMCSPYDLGIHGTDLLEDAENVFSHIEKKSKTLSLTRLKSRR